MVTRDLVELVAVDEQETATVGEFMHMLAGQFDVAEGGVEIAAQRLVVVAGNQHHALAVAGAAQQLLDDGVLRRRPVDAAAHGPEIDDVADQEDVIGGMFAEELEETFRLARAGAEVDVREEE